MSANSKKQRDIARVSLAEVPAVNPIEELAEIEIYKTQSVTDKDFCIGLVTRFASYGISCENWSYGAISRLKEATVKLNFENCTIDREGRYGDAARPQSLSATRTVKNSAEQFAKLHGKISLGGGISSAGALTSDNRGSVSAEAGRTSSAASTESYDYKDTISSIEAMPGGRWKIVDVFSDYLRGKYEPNEHLCKINISPDYTFGSVIASLYFYPKDITLELYENDTPSIKKLMKEKPNNVAVAKALIAKHLKEINPVDNNSRDGRIVIGMSRIDFKVNEDGN